MFDQIADADLKESDLPPLRADWGQIGAFALTFDGYDHWGSFEECAKVGNQWQAAFAERQALPESLTDLRTCLFFEQRRWRHFGYDPDEQAWSYIRALVDAIRQEVMARTAG